MKKRVFCAVLAVLLVIPMTACKKQTVRRVSSENREKTSKTETGRKKEETVLNLQIGTTTFQTVLYDNKSARAFRKQLPMTISMDELNGNEKYYYLDGELPEDSQKVKEIRAGDLMLYGSDCLVLFYKDFKTTYAYTKLGYIENPDGLTAALGRGSKTVTFRMEEN